MTDNKVDALLSVEEAAQRLGGISKHTIHAWFAQKKLRRTKVGSRTMVRESELQRVIQDESREDNAPVKSRKQKKLDAEPKSNQNVNGGSRMVEPKSARTVFLTVKECASQLGLSERTIWDWVYQHRIEIVRLGRAVRIKQSSLDKFIESGTVPVVDPSID